MKRLTAGAALLLVLPAAAAAATHTINQVGNSWQPNEITIEVGDTVEWVWSAGGHTVTSGTGPDDPEVGLLFDESLNTLNPLVTHTFTETGDISFFCRPHFLFGMTGVVHVLTPVSANEPVEAATWARIKGLYR